MKCPTCDYDMRTIESSATRGRNNVTYTWTKYQCKRDDVWVEVWEPEKSE